MVCIAELTGRSKTQQPHIYIYIRVDFVPPVLDVPPCVVATHSSHATTHGCLVQTEPFLLRYSDDGPPTETNRFASTVHAWPILEPSLPHRLRQLPFLRRYTETPRDGRRRISDSAPFLRRPR
jgi:acetyl esterase/lipase